MNFLVYLLTIPKIQGQHGGISLKTQDWLFMFDTYANVIK